MATEDEMTIPALRMQVSILQRDFYKHAEQVNESLQRIFEFMASEMGARRERETAQAASNHRSDLTWTKVMAIAAVFGALQISPTVIRAFFQ